MKNFFNKILLVALVTVFGGVLSGCNPEPEKKEFSVAFKDFGPGYVSLMATVPHPMTVSYLVLSEEEAQEEGFLALDETMLQTVLSMTGKKAYFYKDGVQQLLDYEIEENTHYYVYLVGILGESEFSKMYTFEFDSGTFTFNQLATSVGVTPDGFKMHLQMPKSVNASQYGKPGARGVRFNHANLMMYNLQSSSGSNDYEFLLWNGGRWVNKDTTLLITDSHNYGEVGYDANEDGNIDSLDMGMLWDPIAPGEPTIFIAGEFEWMQEPWYGLTGDEKAAAIKKYQEENNMDPTDDNYVVNGFYYPAGWQPGYYLPCIDSAKYWSFYGGASTKGAGIITDINKDSPLDYAWTGAFSRKVFRSRVPDRLDASFDVKIEDLRSIDATVCITPDKNIYRYLFTILDEASYQYMLKLLEGREEYLQWAVTSFFAMMEFGAMEVVAGNGETSAPVANVVLSDLYYDVPSETQYHVLITGMSGEIGSPQCFHHSTFSTPAKTKTTGPEIEVTALPDKTTPYSAAFNVKCVSTTTNPCVRCYYGANYYKDWVFDVNSGGSYEEYGQSVQFSDEELELINSDEGYDMYIPSIDGAKTRLVVVGFNDENVSNGVDTYEDVLAHPAVDDCTTPYAEAEDLSYNPLLDNGLLDGEWTLTATVLNGTSQEVQKSKVHIKSQLAEGVDYPKNLPDSVMTLYKEVTKWTEEEIEGYFDEFKNLAAVYNEKRLRNQNKLVLEGWMDNDSHGRLSLMAPWDMFVSREVSTVDVESMFTEYGPKMYIKVNKDKQGRDSLAITANKYFASPVANWSVPFYMAGYANQETNNTIFYFGTSTEFQAPLEFAVEMSDDKNTLTIKGFERDGVVYYPNVIGEDTQSLMGGYILEKPIISDVVLTRGWSEQEAVQQTKTKAAWGMKAYPVAPAFKPTLVKFSKRTRFEKIKPVRVEKIDYKLIPYEQLLENLEKYKTNR